MNGETVLFRFYDSDAEQILPVLEEIDFIADVSYGTPDDPFDLESGNMLIAIDSDNLATITVVDDTWSGSETTLFTTTDTGTLNGYSDSTSATYTCPSQKLYPEKKSANLFRCSFFDLTWSILYYLSDCG